jgi:hypothetical protein
VPTPGPPPKVHALEKAGFGVVRQGEHIVTARAGRIDRRSSWQPGFDSIAAREVVTQALARLLSHRARPTWEEVASELNKGLHWKYDNYRLPEAQPAHQADRPEDTELRAGAAGRWRKAEQKIVPARDGWPAADAHSVKWHTTSQTPGPGRPGA